MLTIKNLSKSCLTMSVFKNALRLLLGDNYCCRMKFMDHIFDDQVVDELTVKIILPEGSK